MTLDLRAHRGRREMLALKVQQVLKDLLDHRVIQAHRVHKDHKDHKVILVRKVLLVHKATRVLKGQ